ncbi:molecular chaperone (small heat shock protein) [Desulfitobacterium dichloroeliminans LMG P-21439]|uniref:Molecular chaperone (Small heat shock protein) n=1 Tax=Desulfitobacterium dichloroeliminans (strain LMG P-21439 / DCA1) TaxID=871963 RepID=L0FBL9_DESDL|nr:Hsp20/alpha crystallin family protein [Desulfitobacterium dichloroeliminans]AGA70026.1 molecular chaperone (small heat shock protein) [Desulfitobacterium dichloroeliminans LMG P-21439]
MPLVPYGSFRIFDQYWDDINSNLLRGRGKEDLAQFLYRVDVEETSSQIYVTAEIPGLDKKEDLCIEIDENQLTISGEIKRTNSGEERSTHRVERYYGRFSRTLTLPAVVKADGAHASYKNGVLELSFLKDRHPAARTIEVDFH